MNRFFSTPKKAVISTICITAVVLGAAVGVPTIVLNNTLIGKDEAEKTALADAGLNASEVSACRTELDFEDGHFQYEVDFYSNGAEYEYLILAKDGGIISRDIDGQKYADSSVSGTVSDKSSKNEKVNNENSDSNIQSLVIEDESAQSSEITLEEAKSAALRDAGVNESDAVFTKTEYDRERSAQVYDIEFYTADAEYDYEINAADGTVREKKTDSYQAAEITLEEAKSAALKDAGLSEADVTFTKESLDRDGSIQKYDIEFYTADAEYDYEINAYDGTVAEKSIDSFRLQDNAGNAAAVNSEKYIGIDRAKEIALAHAGLTEKEVSFSKAKMENDDGETEYEIDFYFGAVEYEYSIDAVTGDITEYNSERD